MYVCMHACMYVCMYTSTVMGCFMDMMETCVYIYIYISWDAYNKLIGLF